MHVSHVVFLYNFPFSLGYFSIFQSRFGTVMATLCRSVRALGQNTFRRRCTVSTLRWYSEQTSENTAGPEQLVNVEIDKSGMLYMIFTPACAEFYIPIID